MTTDSDLARQRAVTKMSFPSVIERSWNEYYLLGHGKSEQRGNKPTSQQANKPTSQQANKPISQFQACLK